MHMYSVMGSDVDSLENEGSFANISYQPFELLLADSTADNVQ